MNKKNSKELSQLYLQVKSLVAFDRFLELSLEPRT